MYKEQRESLKTVKHTISFPKKQNKKLEFSLDGRLVKKWRQTLNLTTLYSGCVSMQCIESLIYRLFIMVLDALVYTYSLL